MDAAPDQTIIWETLGGICTTIGVGFLYLLGLNSKVRKDYEEEDSKLSDRIEAHADNAARGQLDQERRFATKDDLNDLAREMRAEFRRTNDNIDRIAHRAGP